MDKNFSRLLDWAIFILFVTISILSNHEGLNIRTESLRLFSKEFWFVGGIIVSSGILQKISIEDVKSKENKKLILVLSLVSWIFVMAFYSFIPSWKKEGYAIHYLALILSSIILELFTVMIFFIAQFKREKEKIGR
jgi:hypothetical protein